MVKNILLSLFSLGLFLLLLESGAYLCVRAEVVELENPRVTQLKVGTEDWRWAHITADKKMEPDPVLFWRPQPRPPFTSQRFKGPEVTVPKSSDVFRIMCYGDSNTEGPLQGHWPEYLQKELNADGGDVRYEVLNAGVGGYSSLQGLRRLREEIKTYQPDLVLVSFGWNDLTGAIANVQDKDYRLSPRIFVAIERILLKTYFYRILKASARKMMKPYHQTEELVSRVPIEEYRKNLKSFDELARQHNAFAIYLTRPHRPTEEVIKKKNSWRAQVPFYNQEGLSLFQKLGAPVMDVQKHFENQEEYFSDECHFTNLGHQKMARFIHAELMELGLLKS